MTSTQTREPARPRRTAQSAGSRLHPDTIGLLVLMAAWLFVTVIAAFVAAASAAQGVDPTIYLGVIGGGWLFVTPWAMPSFKRRTGQGGPR
ncbi:MAG: hypothetical protein ACRDP6_37220 [Actinoallomurus sp.]